jgi:hypothetical protein
MEGIRRFFGKRMTGAEQDCRQGSRTDAVEQSMRPRQQEPSTSVKSLARTSRQQRQRQIFLAPVEYANDEGTCRAVGRATCHKMLALPIPIIRPADINSCREPGHTGINPVTLAGTTALLPGALGQGKECVNSMPFYRLPSRPQPGRDGTRRITSALGRSRQQSSADLVSSVTELRMQYAQNMLNKGGEKNMAGNACHESRQLPRFSVAAPRESHGDEAGAAGDEDQWVDTSDEENLDKKNLFECRTEAEHKAKDSGYSSDDQKSRSYSHSPKRALAPRGGE